MAISNGHSDSYRHNSVPIVDFTPVTNGNGDVGSRQRVAQDLLAKGRTNGFVGITGHGLSSELLREAFKVAAALFDLPLEEKMKAPHPEGSVPHRGYSCIGREQGAAMLALKEKDPKRKAELQAIKDYKETYEVGSEHNTVQYNIWLPDSVLPGFQPFALHLYWTLHDFASLVLDTLIASLEVTEDEAQAIRALYSGHDNSVRLAHYPPRPTRDADGLFSRLGPHTDWSLFTLLFQDGCGGLEVQDRVTKEFVLAEPLEGVVYMNIGDMFDRVSNGLYPSAIHRVTVPKGLDTPFDRDRYSIPYFVSTRNDGLVATPESLIARMGGERRYQPVMFRDYSEMMFGAVHSRE